MRRVAPIMLFAVLAPVAAGAAADLAELSALLRALRSEDAWERSGALHEIEELGLDAASALPEIIRALDDPDERVRKNAADALAAIGPEAAPAIPKLIAMLGDGQIQRVSTDMGGFFDACEHAAWALDDLGPEAVGPLVRALEDPNPVVRYHATWALENLRAEAKAAIPALLKLFNDDEEMIRMQAVRAVFEIGADAKAVVPAIIQRLDDAHVGTRVAAVDALGSLRPLMPEAVKGLMRALHDEEGLVQRHAIDALGALGADAAPALPALCEVLKSRESYPFPESHPFGFRPVAEAAAEALGQIGPAAKAAVPSLLAAVRDTEFSYNGLMATQRTDAVRIAGVKAAARIDPNGTELLRLLEECLRHGDDIGGGAIFAAAGIGPKAKSLVPLLVERMRQAEPRQRLLLASAILHIEPGHTKATDTLVGTLNANTSPDDEGWKLVRSALKVAGPEARRVIPTLTEMLLDDPVDELNTVRTLGQFGPAARLAVPALIDLLPGPVDEYHREVVEALQRITHGRPDVFSRVVRYHSPEVRCGIIEVLGASSESVELLVGLLYDPSARVRLAAVTALGRLGEPARDAIPDAKRLLSDERPTVRKAAERTISQLKK